MPPSARKYREWWANGGHSQANSWLNAGWQVSFIELGKSITFEKKIKHPEPPKNAVKVFCGEDFENEHEWNQFKEVYNLISENYTNTDELIYILSNFRMSGMQIDVLIITKKGIAILDLKSYKGEVIGNENGDWKVIDKNGEEVTLKTNLFGQLKSQKFAFLEKLKKISEEYSIPIEKDKLARIKCWGYFKKGSSYDIKQMGEGTHIWFDVITEDKLLEKMRFLNAGYEFKLKDIDAIVKGLNLKEYHAI